MKSARITAMVNIEAMHFIRKSGPWSRKQRKDGTRGRGLHCTDILEGDNWYTDGFIWLNDTCESVQQMQRNGVYHFD